MKVMKNVIMLLGIFIFITACAGSSEIGINKDTVYDKPMPNIEYEYELGPGDVLEIVYHYTPKPDTADYYLSVGDIVKVEFAYHADVSRTLPVSPAGNISLPQRGDLHVIGITPQELQKKIVKIYSDEFINPVVTVTMVQSNRAIDRLRTSITTSARGQSKLTTVRPDGYVSFPMINDVMAKGKTIPELKRVITNEYSKKINNLTITLILKIMKANLVYIMGEVAKPNYYLMEGPTTVSQLIARAGGVLNTAEKSTIMVISRDKHRRPWARLVNFEKIINTGDISRDIVLQQYDIVYVPKTAIARRNLFIEQYLNRMIPPNLLGPYNMGGTLINNRPLIN